MGNISAVFMEQRTLPQTMKVNIEWAILQVVLHEIYSNITGSLKLFLVRMTQR